MVVFVQTAYILSLGCYPTNEINMHGNEQNVRHGRFFMTNPSRPRVGLCQHWQLLQYCYYFKNWSVLQDRYDVEHYSHEWESGACWGTLFAFGRWTVRQLALQDELTEDVTWKLSDRKMCHPSLCCNLPIISNFQDKQSHVRMEGVGGRCSRNTVHTSFSTYAFLTFWEALRLTVNQGVGWHPTAPDIKATKMKRKSRSCFPQGLI